MATEEKLEHFSSFCIESAGARSIKMLDEYTNTLERTFEEHQVDAIRHTGMRLDVKTAKM